MRSDLENGWVPAGWAVRSLEDLCTFRSGGTPPKSNPALWSGSFPWVSGKDLKTDRLVDSIDHITTDAAQEYSNVAPAGAVLVLVRGMGLANGFPSALVERPMAFNQDLKALVPRGAVTGEFLRHALAFSSDRILHNVSAAAHGTKRLSQDDLRGFRIPVPPLSEQRSISAVLENALRARNLEARSLEAVTKLKRAAMHELFTRGLRLERQKETEIGLLPESWSVAHFASTREWLQYGTSERCTVERAAFPVLRIPNVVAGRVTSENLKYCDLSDPEAEKYILEPGDLLFIRTNGVLERLGSCAVYEGTPARALFASYLIRARLKQDLLVPRFAALFFASEEGTAAVFSRATPAADGKYNLNTGIIDSLPVPIPPLEEQQEIVKLIEAIDRKIDLHQRKRVLLEDLFRALLHKLMTGEIRVSDLDLSAIEGPAEKKASV